MKKRVISFIYLIYFIIFSLCAEYIDAPDLALTLNIVLLIGLVLYYAIIGLLKVKLIPRNNIIIWFILIMVTIPLIMVLGKIGIIDTSTGVFGLDSGGMEYIFFVPINLIFIFGLIVENFIIFLIFKIREL